RRPDVGARKPGPARRRGGGPGSTATDRATPAGATSRRLVADDGPAAGPRATGTALVDAVAAGAAGELGRGDATDRGAADRAAPGRRSAGPAGIGRTTTELASRATARRVTADRAARSPETARPARIGHPTTGRATADPGRRNTPGRLATCRAIPSPGTAG